MRRTSRKPVTFQVELEKEAGGRWIAEISQLPGVLAYGDTRAQACARVQALALRVVADRLEHGEAGPELLQISFAAA
ncbi:MAG: type II toxin-antitoxin system HicB family antitoxin [Candidatus Acidiferrales bacterium]